MKTIKPTHLGLGLIGLGFIFMVLAWNGAARVNFVDGQIPYVISGGFIGLAMVFVGGGLMLFEASRRQSAHMQEKFDVLIEILRENGSGAAPAAAGARAAAPVPPAGRKAAGSNGMVVVGRSSFHRPDCRLVDGKENVDLATSDDAKSRGLTPCRVCDPTRTAARR